jgi:hypothetical protein
MGHQVQEEHRAQEGHQEPGGLQVLKVHREQEDHKALAEYLANQEPVVRKVYQDHKELEGNQEPEDHLVCRHLALEEFLEQVK